MKKFVFIFTLYIICCTICASTKDFDSISITLLEETEEDFVFVICNSTNDSTYLFDSYFEKCNDGYIYTSKYFHRYDKKNKIYKLSLLPILPELSLRGCCSDVLVFNKDKIIQNGHLTFTFSVIAPHDTLTIHINKDAFLSLFYVEDFHAERLSCYHHILNFNKMKIKTLKIIPKQIILELGIYKTVSNMLKWCGEVSMDELDEQATNMIVSSLFVNINI